MFNSLFTITNMPINRFKLHLDKSGQYEAYMEKLLAAFNPAAAEGVMCRSLLSVGHDGRIYDCDFNQMLEMDAVDAKRQAAEHFRLRFRPGPAAPDTIRRSLPRLYRRGGQFLRRRDCVKTFGCQ